jgi:YD repeat-containing protein
MKINCRSTSVLSLVCSVLFLGMFLAFDVNGQVKPPTFANPNAASLGKYGDIPVTYHTGVPEISIPIYTLSEGALNVPISLSYHSSGVKVDETASWVGLGWSLNAGGSITRTVVGGPDEGVVNGSMPGAMSPYTRWGWYKDGGIIPQITQCGPRPVSTEGPTAGTFPTWQGCRALYLEAAKGYIDCEPDLFTYNVGGYSGKFYFDSNREVRMLPESDVHIEPVNSPSYFYSWKMIAPDGTKYYFGGAAKEISCSDLAESGSNKDVASSTTWLLYKIESVNGENWINFEYADETYSFGNRGGHSVTFEGNSAYGGAVQGDVDESSLVLGLSTVEGKRLTKITTSSGFVQVDFVPSSSYREDLTIYDKTVPTYTAATANNSAKSLKYIQITTGAKCKKFELSHDYFSSATCPGYPSSSDFDKKRLRLNWVRESTCDNLSINPKYEFVYDATLLPRRYSLARDHWGYYNGFDTNTGLLEAFPDPSPYVTTTYTTNNYRTVVEAKMKAGILTKIIYPTGGSTEFDYEAHRETSTSPMLGGLRVKSVVTSDAQGNTSTKLFTYEQGKLYQNPANYLFQYPNNNDLWTGAFLGMLDFGILHSSSPVPPMYTSQGYHIGYSKVTVSETGNGKTVYTYLNSSPTTVNNAEYPNRRLVADPGTTEMVSNEVWTNGNSLVAGGYSVPQKTSADKTTYARRVEYVYCLNCTPAQGYSSMDYGLWMDYTINTYRFNVVQKSETKDGVTTTTYLSYDPSSKHNNPVSTQFTDSKGKVRKTEITYASATASGAPAVMYDKTQTDFKNMLGTPVEQRAYGDNVLTSKSTTQYGVVNSKLLVSESKNYPSGTSEFTNELYEYDKVSNVTAISKSNGSTQSFLWAYNNSMPVAAVTNAKYQEYLVPLSQAFTVSPTTNVSSYTNLTGSFTISEEQAVTFNPTVTLNGAPGLWVDLTLKNSSGTVVFGPHRYSSNGTFAESVFLPAGTYTFCYQSGNYPSPYQGYSSLSFTVNGFSSRRANLFHTSFEESGVVTDARTGSKALLGTYPVKMPHLLGDYMLTYWTKPSAGDFASWQLVQVPITVTSSSMADYVIGQSGYHVDEVRLYPKGAMMTTYTYEPGVGMSSTTDPNNVSSFYEYDAFGRLIGGKDNNKHLVKAYQYHLKGQN